MNYQIFVIDYDIVDDNYDTLSSTVGIYNNFEIAKKKIKQIFEKTPDYKFFCYKIKIYNLVENEYKFTNKFYTYDFNNKFTEYIYSN
jgi:hypothetical protein